MWRLLIGLGCIPGIVALYFRLTIPESPRYTADIERNVLRAAQEVELYLTDPSIVIDPGYYATFFFIDKWGRIPIQKLGFASLTLLFIVLGASYDSLAKTSSGQKGVFAIYCVANFFQNFGPNSTTFIIPGEAFPTRYRATAHGLSAAPGRLGILIAQLVVFFLEKTNEDKCTQSYVRYV